MTILKPFFHAGAMRRPGDEQALAETKPSDEQIKSWVDRNLVEVEGVTPRAKGALDDKTQRELDAVLRPYIGETGESETVVDVAIRFLRERDELRDEADDLREDNRSLRNLVDSHQGRIDEMQAELESLRVPSENVAPSGEATTPIEAATPVEAKELTEVLGSAKAALSLINAGYTTRQKINAATDKELNDLGDIAEKSIEKLRAAFSA